MKVTFVIFALTLVIDAMFPEDAGCVPETVLLGMYAHALAPKIGAEPFGTAIVAFTSPKIRLVLAFMLPATSNATVGVVVPIPTLLDSVFMFNIPVSP